METTKCEEKILGCIFLYRVGGVRGWKLGWWWEEVEAEIGEVNSGLIIVKMCVKEAPVQRLTSLT